MAAERMPRVVVLPLSDRASVVLEAEQEFESVTQTRDSCGQPASPCIVAEGGPIGKDMRPLELTSPSSVPLVRRVSLETYARPDGRTNFRLRVQLAATCEGDGCNRALRIAGNRLYVDVSRIRPARPPVESASEVPSAGASRAGNTQREVSAPSRGAPADAARPDIVDYDTLKSDILRRAQQRAQQPDVKGLLALIGEIHRKDEQLGQQRPDLVAELLDEVNRLLDQARVRQLDLDRQALRKSAPAQK